VRRLPATREPAEQKQNHRDNQRNDRMFDVNMRGAYLVTRHKSRQLARRYDEIHDSGNNADNRKYIGKQSHLAFSLVTRSNWQTINIGCRTRRKASRMPGDAALRQRHNSVLTGDQWGGGVPAAGGAPTAGPRGSSLLAVHFFMNLSRAAPFSFWSSAPNLQVSIFAFEVIANDGELDRTNAKLAAKAASRSMAAPPNEKNQS
jgi:hypothetical protein